MSFNRRSFVAAVSGGALGLACSCKQVAAHQKRQPRPSSQNFNIGLAAYSFREHFEFFKGKAQKPRQGESIDMFGFIDYCAKHHCGAELTSYFFPPGADQGYFRKIKRHAFVNGVPIVGTAIGNNFTIPEGEKLASEIADAKRWIDNAAQMGAPHIRFFAGTRKQLAARPDAMKLAIESLQTCVDHAAQYGIFVGVENHGELTASDVLQIVNGVESDWFGVNLDTGNFVTGDPYLELEKCAPHAVNVQVKVKMKNERGESTEADFERVAGILAAANYRGYVVLEYEEDHPFDSVPNAMIRLRKCFAN